MFLDLSLPFKVDPEEPSTTREDALRRLGHKGTHLDRLLNTEPPLDYVKSRGLCFDVSGRSPAQALLPGDIDLSRLRPRDFVIFHTGVLSRLGYGSRAYLDEYFELSWELIDIIIQRPARFIGVDVRGIRKNQEHREADERCERAGVYVIENLANTERLPLRESFNIYSFCFDAGGTGLPCRVIAEIAD